MIEVNKSTVIDEKMIKESQITEENGMQYAIAAIARQIMKIVIWKVKELDMEWSDFLDTLRDIWGSQEDDNYESAYEILFLMLMTLEEDSKKVIESFIYPDEDIRKDFMDYFCEYLIDSLMLEELKKEAFPTMQGERGTQKIREVYKDSICLIYCI